jgi:hypothetical protein
MRTISVSGLLAETLQGEAHYWVGVDLGVDDTGRIVSVSPSLLPGPRPWPPTGDYKLVYFYAGEQRVEHVHIRASTWQQAALGAI